MNAAERQQSALLANNIMGNILKFYNQPYNVFNRKITVDIYSAYSDFIDYIEFLFQCYHEHLIHKQDLKCLFGNFIESLESNDEFLEYIKESKKYENIEKILNIDKNDSNPGTQ